ncbi:MAG: hypothetical protein PHO88_07055 [Clostridia bacterium]|nr:hypothetical protein [Clostridia bacterium]
MSKKNIIMAITLIVLIILISCYFLFNRTMKLSENYNFKKIYDSKQNIENIEIKILDIKSNELTDITDAGDISEIINTIKEENITPNVRLGEALLGKAYLFRIKNKYNNNSVEVDITTNQLTIDNKTYTTENNLIESLNAVYSKYK